MEGGGSTLVVDRSHQLLTALVPLVEAAVAPLRAELADLRATLSARDQELGTLRAELAALRATARPALVSEPSRGLREFFPSRLSVSPPGRAMHLTIPAPWLRAGRAIALLGPGPGDRHSR